MTQAAAAAVLYQAVPVAVAAQQWTDVTNPAQITIAKITSVSTTYPTGRDPTTNAMVQSLVFANLSYGLLLNQWIVIGANTEQTMDDATFKAMYAASPTGNALALAVGPVATDPLTANLVAYANFTGTVTINWGDGATDTLNVTAGASAQIPHTYAAAATYSVVVLDSGGKGLGTAKFIAYRPQTAPAVEVMAVSEPDTSADQTPPVAIPNDMDRAAFTGNATFVSPTNVPGATPIEVFGDLPPEEMAKIPEFSMGDS